MNVISININEKKGEKKFPVDKCILIEGKGVAGDAHFGLNDSKQVSILCQKYIDNFKKTLINSEIEILPGSFGENLTVSGEDALDIKIGDRFESEKLLLEVSKIGKECHKFCAIGKTVGKCIMPERGFFARVLKGGELKKGDNLTKI